MEKEKSLVEDLILKSEDYAKTSYELSKLKLLDNSSTVISSIAAQAVAGVILLISVLIISMGLAFYTGELLGKVYYGFFAVGTGYIIIALCCYLFLSARIKKLVSKYLQAMLFA